MRADGGNWEMSDRWGINRMSHEDGRAGWFAYKRADGSLQVPTFDSAIEAHRAMKNMVPKSRYTRKRFSFTIGLIPLRVWHQIEAGTYRPYVPRGTGDLIVQKREWIEDERRDARMEASEREYFRRREGVYNDQD